MNILSVFLQYFATDIVNETRSSVFASITSLSITSVIGESKVFYGQD